MGLKKLYWLIITVLILISILFTSSELTSSARAIELLEITKKAKQADVEIASWSMAIKKPIVAFDNIEDVQNSVQEIKSHEIGFEWSEEQFKGNHYKIVGIKKGDYIDEETSFIYYKMDNKYNLIVTYKVDGSQWHPDIWAEVYNQYKTKMDRHKVFFTVEGFFDTGDNKGIEAEAQNLVKNMSGKAVESLDEENFISISAYTPHWDVKVPLGEKGPMNMQVAYRNSGDITEVTIGSPIIITEY
ncbi:YwmB family TATA-box binding protein [Halobacillus litoralis]|uniref:YwmB family TATA-box binding protein n=1 Tax=Halobacillus litoralis TaxID=45668 RepID=UPI0024928CF6|nr:YwmB family TATA-box binding protein [Halobacillus litoralis]